VFALMVAWDKEFVSVKLNSLFAVALVLGAVALTMRSQTTTPKPAAMPKIAVIQMRQAMIATQEGQVAGKAMQAEFGPKRATMEKEDAAIVALEDQLRKGSATMSADGGKKMQDEIARRKTKLQRDVEDLDQEQQAADNKVTTEITGKLGEVIDKMAKANGYTVVMDASAPLLWASDGANITPEVIKAYDAAYPVKGATPPAPAPKK
jgi:outer membrane protein